MANLYTQADSNIRKTWAYLFFFMALIIGTGWTISYFLDNSAILIVSIIVAILTNFFSYWYSDKIVLSMSKAQLIKKEDSAELYRLVENLAITAGLPTPRIYIINESQPNAFATGRNPENGVIAVTRGLLEKLNRVELEGVLAHEMAHIGNRDVLLSTIIVVLVGIIVYMTDFFIKISFRSSSGKNDKNSGGARAITGLVALFLSILAPLFAKLMKLAISRKREFLADSTGALLTRYPEGLASALEKIAIDSTPLSTANNATAHLYISNPFKNNHKISWLQNLFSTHPPVEERILKLREQQ